MAGESDKAKRESASKDRHTESVGVFIDNCKNGRMVLTERERERERKREKERLRLNREREKVLATKRSK